MTENKKTALNIAALIVVFAFLVVVVLAIQDEKAKRITASSVPKAHYMLIAGGYELPIETPKKESCFINEDMSGCTVLSCLSVFDGIDSHVVARTCEGSIVRIQH